MPNNRNRFLDFTPSQEEAVVSRILVLVHQAIDENFPVVEKADRQFTKTIFTNEGETSELSAAPGPTFGEIEATSPLGVPANVELAGSESADISGATPRLVKSPTAGVGPRGSQPPLPRPPIPKPPVKLEQETKSTASAGLPMDSDFDEVNFTGRDWSMRLMIVLFIAGAVLLAYTVYS